MKRIGLLVYPQFQVMSFAAISAFEMANESAGEMLYDVRLLSEHGGAVPTSMGLSVQTTALKGVKLDTVMVGGGLTKPETSPGLRAYLRRAAGGSVRRVAAICSGAFLLAQAGVLDGRRATTHWAHAAALRADHPLIKVEDDRIFIADGNVWTSAGMTAAIDLALALIEHDHGEELAKLVAKKLVVYHRRAGGQSQFSVLLDLKPKTDRIQTALAYARRNLKAELSVEELAEAAHLSPRQFSRSFRAETGQSPAKAVENLRVEAARVLLEEGRLPTQVVASETGFADPERMRRAFLRTLGQPPHVIRRNARGGVAAVV